MKIGIITALDIESNPVRSKLADVSGQNVAYTQMIRGKRKGHDVYIVNAGVGKVSASMATQLLIDVVKPDILLNVGVAGALRDGLSVNAVVVGTRFAQHDVVGAPWLGRKRGEVPFSGEKSFPVAPKDIVNQLLAYKGSVSIYDGCIISGDEPIFSEDRKSELVSVFSDLNPVAVDMESAAFAYVAAVNRIPFGVVRAISDNASKNDRMTFTEDSMNNMEAPEVSARVAIDFIDRI